MMRTRSVIFVAAIAMASSTVSASSIFHYIGQPFSTASAPFTTADFVTGNVEFSSPPAPFDVLDETDIADYSLSSGPLTLTPATPGSAVSASFTFDAGGNISAWLITVTGFTPGSAAGLDEIINTDWNGVNDGDDYTDIDDATAGQAFNDQVPGVWVLIPEPSSGVLLAAGGLMIFRRRRRGRPRRTS